MAAAATAVGSEAGGGVDGFEGTAGLAAGCTGTQQCERQRCRDRQCMECMVCSRGLGGRAVGFALRRWC